MKLPNVIWYLVAAMTAVAAVGELLVAIRIVDANLYCNNGNECKLDDTWATVVSVVALVMWALVSLITLNAARSPSSSEGETLPS